VALRLCDCFALYHGSQSSTQETEIPAFSEAEGCPRWL